MPTPSQAAQLCFRENMPYLNTAVPSQNSPDVLERWNLYNGLANLAEAIGNLEQKLVALRVDLARLRRG